MSSAAEDAHIVASSFSSPSKASTTSSSAERIAANGHLLANGDGEASLLAEDFEPLEDLDDDEYGLPTVDYTPSLDEILEDADEEDDQHTEWNATVDISQSPAVAGVSAATALLESLSVTSGGSGGSRSIRSIRGRKCKDGVSPAGGAIVRHVVLKGISAQMAAAAKRVGAGHPSAIAASTLIAVGTLHGFILIFDSKQVLRWSLGSKKLGDDLGGVSALAFNPDCSRLLVGFAKGQLVEFDVMAGKMVQTLTDAHPPGSAVIHVRYTDDPNGLAIVGDSGGSVFEVSFKRTLRLKSYSSK